VFRKVILQRSCTQGGSGHADGTSNAEQLHLLERRDKERGVDTLTLLNKSTIKKLENSINLSNRSRIIVFPDPPHTSFVLRRRFSFPPRRSLVVSPHSSTNSMSPSHCSCRCLFAVVHTHRVSRTCVAVSLCLHLSVSASSPSHHSTTSTYVVGSSFVVCRSSFVVRRSSFVVHRSSFIVRRHVRRQWPMTAELTSWHY